MLLHSEYVLGPGADLNILARPKPAEFNIVQPRAGPARKMYTQVWPGPQNLQEAWLGLARGPKARPAQDTIVSTIL